MKNNKNHAMSVAILIVISILLVFACRKDLNKDEVSKREPKSEEDILIIKKMAQLNIGFALVDDIYYEKDSTKRSIKQFAEFVISDALIKEFISNLDTSFKSTKTAKDLSFDVIIKSSYLNQKQENEQINKHREAILTFRYWIVNKWLSGKISTLDMLSTYGEATQYIISKSDYSLIKKREMPLIQKMKKVYLKKKLLLNYSKTIEHPANLYLASYTPNTYLASYNASRVYKVTLITPDGTFTIDCSSDKYILDAAKENGITLPFSCNCGADRTSVGRVYSGTVDQSDQCTLTDSEIENGFVILAVAYPSSDVVILTDQEEQLNHNNLNTVNIIGHPPADPFPQDWYPGNGGDSDPGNSGGGSAFGGSAGNGIVSVTADANHARLCGVPVVIKVGNSYTGGIQNLGFTMQLTTTTGTSSIPVIIGEACFSTKNSSSALASAAFLTAYNLALEAIMYEVKWGIITEVNSVTLRQALITQIIIALQVSGGSGSSFSTGGCLGNVPSTVATYYH